MTKLESALDRLNELEAAHNLAKPKPSIGGSFEEYKVYQEWSSQNSSIKREIVRAADAVTVKRLFEEYGV